jgi:hypothetical protein
MLRRKLRTLFLSGSTITVAGTLQIDDRRVSLAYSESK